jgi:GNAT superfamily N-acetyltransferase
MKVNDLLTEIQRIPSDWFVGGKNSLNKSTRQIDSAPKAVKKLPGGSGYYYSVTRLSSDETSIRIWDPAKKEDHERFGTVIGELLIKKESRFPLKNTYKVDYITIDEDYRNQGIAKSLYGIALTILKVNLLAGDAQTLAGRKMWVSLSKIPGVEVVGWVMIEEGHDKIKDIEDIIAQAGAFSIGSIHEGDHIFFFDVEPGSNGKEMVEKIKTKLSKVYGGWKLEGKSGLLAHWVG